MNSTPISLLERLRQPVDQEAWSRFVELYSPVIYAWGRQVGLSETDAADLAQEVFVILVGKMPGFNYDQNAGPGKAARVRRAPLCPCELSG